MENELLAMSPRELVHLKRLILPCIDINLRFSVIARSITSMSQLQAVDLEGHAITELDLLRGLGELFELNLARNCIQDCGVVIKLKSLRVLNLSGNFISSLPSAICNLTHLRRLDISENSLASISDLIYLGKCPNLYWLNVMGNPVTKSSQYRKRLLSHCNGLACLDLKEVSSKEMIIDLLVEQDSGKDVSDERVTRLTQENQELKSELQATSQLLARKTSEWAIAEEQSSRLQQELAFLKIDGPVKITKQIPPVTQSEIVTESFATSQSPFQLSVDGHHSAVTDPVAVLEQIEKEILANGNRAGTKIRELLIKYNESKSEVDHLQEDLEIAMTNLQAAKKDDLIPNSQVSHFAENKERDISDICFLIEKLRSWRNILSQKSELAQDLIVGLTEKLVAGESPKSELDELETTYEKFSADAKAAASEVTWALHSNEALTDLFPDYAIIGIETEESLDYGETMFNPAILRLSADVKKASEEDSRAKDCLDACLNRISHIENTLENLNDVRPRSTSTCSEYSTQVSRTHNNTRSAQVRLREIQVSILRVKCDASKDEAILRSKQCAVMFQVVDRKDATIDACNRTIARLQEESYKEMQKEEVVLDDTVASLVSISDEKARMYRQQIFEDLLNSEVSFVEELAVLTRVYLTPMRRRCILPPRDLQIISNNLSDIGALHGNILEQISGQKDPSVVINVFHHRAHKLEVYRTYLDNCAASFGMAEARRFEVSPFSHFLSSCEQSSDSKLDLMQLLLVPIRRMIQYEDIFSRLVSLKTSRVTATTHNKVVAVLTAVRDVLNTDTSTVVDHGMAIAALHRVLPAHSSLINESANWLLDRRLSQHPFKLVQVVDSHEIALFIPAKKAMLFPKALCFVFSDFVVLAAYPQKWRQSFHNEKPRLRAFFLSKGNHSCSKPFATQVTTDIGEQLYGLRVTANSDHEIVFQLRSFDQANSLHDALESISHQEYLNDQVEESIIEIEESTVGSQEDIILYPGTDMTKRREQARILSSKRGAWKPLEDEERLVSHKVLETENTPFNTPTKSSRFQKPSSRPSTIGFGSSVYLKRVKPLPIKRRPATSPRKKPPNRLRFEDHNVDLSIFKAPPSSMHRTSEMEIDGSGVGYQTKRFIGLETHHCEYIKDCLKNEERYVKGALPERTNPLF